MQKTILKEILENNTLYEVEEKHGRLEYLLENNKKIKICEIQDIEFDKIIATETNQYFKIDNGQRITKNELEPDNYGMSNPVEVYSSSEFDEEVFGYIEKTKLLKLKPKQNIYTGKSILLNTGGSVGAIRLKNKDYEYTTIDNVVVYKVIENICSIDYLYYSLLSVMDRSKFNYSNTLRGNDLNKADLIINIPKEKKFNNKLYSSYQIQLSISKNIEEKLKEISIKEQIIKSMLHINEMKVLNTLKFYLSNSMIEINSNKIKFEQIELSKIVDIVGGNSKYNQEYYTLQSNHGIYPLYTGSREITAFIKAIDDDDISKIEFCSYNKDNDAGSKAFYHSTPCIIGGHHNKVIPKVDTNINIKYLFYCLDLLFKTNMFYQSKQPIAGKEIIGNFNIHIPFSDESLKIQQKIVDILENKIENIKLQNINLNKIIKLLTVAKASILNKGNRK